MSISIKIEVDQENLATVTIEGDLVVKVWAGMH